MIMKRIDPDDDQPTGVFTETAGAFSDIMSNSPIPGLLYRGVPQDRRRLLHRIDSVRATGAAVTGPSWLTAKRIHSETAITELFFG